MVSLLFQNDVQCELKSVYRCCEPCLKFQCSDNCTAVLWRRAWTLRCYCCDFCTAEQEPSRPKCHDDAHYIPRVNDWCLGGKQVQIIMLGTILPWDRSRFLGGQHASSVMAAPTRDRNRFLSGKRGVSVMAVPTVPRDRNWFLGGKHGLSVMAAPKRDRNRFHGRKRGVSVMATLICLLLFVFATASAFEVL